MIIGPKLDRVNRPLEDLSKAVFDEDIFNIKNVLCVKQPEQFLLTME